MIRACLSSLLVLAALLLGACPASAGSAPACEHPSAEILVLVDIPGGTSGANRPAAAPDTSSGKKAAKETAAKTAEKAPAKSLRLPDEGLPGEGGAVGPSRILAGVCLALAQGRIAGAVARPLEIRAEFGRAHQVVDARELWLRLSRNEWPGHVCLRWSNPGADGASGARGPYSIKLTFQDQREFAETLARRAAAGENPELMRCAVCRPRTLIFGPTSSDTAHQILQALRKAYPLDSVAVPFVTPSVTATDVHGSRRFPFYRFISTDRVLADRLADQLVSDVHPRRIGILYEGETGGAASSAWGDGLTRDLKECLRQRGYASEKLVEYPYGRKIHQRLSAVALQKPGDAPDPYVDRLREALRRFRRYGVEAVGVFGGIDDKLALVREVQRELGPVQLFTTDADYRLEELADANVLVCSAFDPNREVHHLIQANAFFHATPEVQPNVYMLQARRATQFLLRLAEKMQDDGLRAERALRRWQEAPDEDRIQFHPDGNLVLRSNQPTLLLLQSQRLAPMDLLSEDPTGRGNALTAALSNHTVSLTVIAVYLAACVLILTLTVAGVITTEDGREGSAGAGTECPPNLPRPQYGRCFAGLLCLQGAALLFVALYAGGIFREGQDSSSIVPNGFSSVPTMAALGALSVFALWYPRWVHQRLRDVQYQIECGWSLPRKESLSDAMSKVILELRPGRTIDYLSAAALGLLCSWRECAQGVPIVGEGARNGYYVLSLTTNVLLFYGLVFAWRMRAYPRHLAPAYPPGKNLRRVQRDLCTLAGPSIETAYVSAAVLTGVVLARQPYFDHWSWSWESHTLFALLTAVLLWLFYDGLYQWHRQILAMKQAVINELEHDDIPDSDQNAEFEAVRSVSNWVWDPRTTIKVATGLGMPVLLALLQEHKALSSLLQGLADLLPK